MRCIRKDAGSDMASKEEGPNLDYHCDITKAGWWVLAVRLFKNAEGQVRFSLHSFMDLKLSLIGALGSIIDLLKERFKGRCRDDGMM